MPTRVPSGAGRWDPLRAFVERSVRSLSCTLVSASKTRDAPCTPRPTPPRWCRGRPAAFHELFEPPSASSTSGSRPASPARSDPAEADPAFQELPIPHGVPIPCYSARRIQAPHSDPRVRVSSSDGPGFAPAARLACRVVLRSCFRPGTRLGLPRQPPRPTFHLVRDQASNVPDRVRRPSPRGCPCGLDPKIRSVRSPAWIGSEDPLCAVARVAFRLGSPRGACSVIWPGRSALPRPC
jgi:hypothetical protein